MTNAVKLRKGAKIGQPAAEADSEFLQSCFVNNGTYENLENSESRQCILLGRTGSGKSALISELVRWHRDSSVVISPEGLALNNLANSSVINFFEASGVHLDGFYVLLWKHIISVELIKKKYRITEESGQSRFLMSIGSILKKDRTKETAIEYLRSWGDSFWLETEHRTSDITRKLEMKLEGSAEIGYDVIKLGAKGARSLTDEQKIEVVQHGQRAVNAIQIRELSKVIDLLAEDIFLDNGSTFYICMDGLDEYWASDDVRFKLLKALFETIKSFQKVRNVKIVVTMRTDLIFSLYKNISSPGFQSEKFSGYYLPLKWTRPDLVEMLNRRVSHLFKYQYTGQDVDLNDILPININQKTKTIDYILERTFFRPREAISFLNRCIEQAEGSTSIGLKDIKSAEYLYSDDRLTALCDEWRREYPNLRTMCNLIRTIQDGIEVAHLRNSKLEDFCLKFPKSGIGDESELLPLLDDAVMDAEQGGFPFLQKIVSIFYRVGLVGLKLSATTARIFSFNEGINVEPDHIHLTTKIYVHKAFWVTLGTRTNEFDTRTIQN